MTSAFLKAPEHIVHIDHLQLSSRYAHTPLRINKETECKQSWAHKEGYLSHLLPTCQSLEEKLSSVSIRMPLLAVMN